MIKSKIKYPHLIALSLLSLSAQAGQMGPVDSGSSLHDFFSDLKKQYRLVGGLTGGPDFINNGQAQTLMLVPPSQNHYTVTNGNQTVGDGGGFLGVEHVIMPWLINQFGVSGYADGTIKAQGHMWAFAQPEFDDFTYTYNVNHSRVMFTDKLLTTISRYQAIHPYFSWEVGAGFNNASGYKETAIVDGAIPTAPFANKSKTSFAWGVGVGVDYTINQHIRAGVGYQYLNLGSASLGLTTAESTTDTLRWSNLSANQLRFQLTFLA